MDIFEHGQPLSIFAHTSYIKFKKFMNMVQTRFPFGLSFDEDVLEKVDVKRGLISRSRFIEKIVSDKLEE